MTNNKLTDITTTADLADALGEARAQLAAAKARVTALEDLLKADHVTAADGEHYRVAITYDVTTSRTDWKTVALYHNPSRQLVTAHTRQSVADRVRVSALKK